MEKHCSICGSTNHNKRTCPNKPIEDSHVRGTTYVEEPVSITPKRERLIQHLLEREAYMIHPDLFTQWLSYKCPVSLKELRYVLDTGLNNESMELYMKLAKDIDTLF